MNTNKAQKRCALVILDGWGIAGASAANPINLTNAPFWHKLLEQYPHIALDASEHSVGLPSHQMGNSEVGHITIGAGRVIRQSLAKINYDLEQGIDVENLQLCMLEAARLNNTLHLIGLLSPGGVHSSEQHLFKVLHHCKKLGVKDVRVHAILDGRDVGPKTAIKSIRKCEKMLNTLGYAPIASLSGRMYAMDRDQRWERTELAFNMLTSDEENFGQSAEDMLLASYIEGVNDEFVIPTTCKGFARINQEEPVLFFNFRPDRARQLAQAFTDTNFDKFTRHNIRSVALTTFTEYHPDIPAKVCWSKEQISESLGSILAEAGMKQFRIAETEKYAHVTYFFNGGREEVFTGEERCMIPSPKVATYDLQPEMSAREVCAEFVEKLDDQNFSFCLLNLANPDMVGHTGNFAAAEQAIQVVDKCLEQIVHATLNNNVDLFVTADHGNIEQMSLEDGSKVTSHSLNKVPFLYVSVDKKLQLNDSKSLSLANIAASVLHVLDLKPGSQMEASCFEL